VDNKKDMTAYCVMLLIRKGLHPPPPKILHTGALTIPTPDIIPLHDIPYDADGRHDWWISGHVDVKVLNDREVNIVP
jgi:hypothetical protein